MKKILILFLVSVLMSCNSSEKYNGIYDSSSFKGGIVKNKTKYVLQERMNPLNDYYIKGDTIE